jgi:hypothetical protein
MTSQNLSWTDLPVLRTMFPNFFASYLYIDIFRHIHPSKIRFTREQQVLSKIVKSRIDFDFCTLKTLDRIKSSTIIETYSHISDHKPHKITIRIPKPVSSLPCPAIILTLSHSSQRIQTNRISYKAPQPELSTNSLPCKLFSLKLIRTPPKNRLFS